MGIIALVRPLAIVIISGLTSKRFAAKESPNLPKPVMTSSNIKSTLCFVHISLILSNYPFGGTITPPDPVTGSIITAATVDGS